MARRRPGMLSVAGKKIISSLASSYLYGGTIPPNGAYSGASSLRQALKAWHTTFASPDVDTLSNMRILASRARDLVRNVPAAKAAVRKKTNHVVSTGLMFRSRLDYKTLGISRQQARQKEREITKLFHRWAKSKHSDASLSQNFYQNQALIFSNQFMSGEVFVLLPFIGRPTAYLDLAIKIIESDLCKNPDGVENTRRLSGGIERDQWGAPTAYWFGDSYEQDLEINQGNITRVPAYGTETGRQLVAHIFSPERPGQGRGITEFAPVIESFKQLGRYKDAELMAAVVSGMYTVFIETLTGAPTDQGNVPPEARVGSEPNAAAGDPGEYELSYGGIVDLAENEKVNFANPARPNSNYDPFTSSILKEAGGCLGISAEIVLGHFTTSYTAARAIFLDAYRGFKRDIANLVIDLCEPVKNTALLNAVLAGKIDLPGYLDSYEIKELWEEGVWVAPAPGQLDPLKETQAYALRVANRFQSRRGATQELNGDDYEVVVEELGEELEWEEEAGLLGSVPEEQSREEEDDSDIDDVEEEDSEDQSDEDSDEDSEDNTR